MFCIKTGRFERNLDFLLSLRDTYALAESEGTAILEKLDEVRVCFFACPPHQRIAVPSQVALRQMSDHLKVLAERRGQVSPNLQLTRPVYEDVYRYHIVHGYFNAKLPRKFSPPQEATAEARCVEEELQAVALPSRPAVSPLLMRCKRGSHKYARPTVPRTRCSQQYRSSSALCTEDVANVKHIFVENYRVGCR